VLTINFNAPASKPVEFSGEDEIFSGQPAGIVRGERECDFVPADINVGMMPRLFREPRDGIDEFNRGWEILELVSARDAYVIFLPVRDAGERGFDLSGVEFFQGGNGSVYARRCFIGFSTLGGLHDANAGD
jgi:hypothetical protein